MAKQVPWPRDVEQVLFLFIASNPYASALRFIHAGTEQHHDKIFELGDRVRQLEEALDEVYLELYVGKIHPLLAPDLLKIKTSQKLYGSAGHFSPPDAREESLNLSFGGFSLNGALHHAFFLNTSDMHLISRLSCLAARHRYSPRTSISSY